MSDKTKIEYADATWNPITGCSIESVGCKNCYAMKLAGGRLKHHPSRAGLTRDTKSGPVWIGKVKFNDEWLNQPLLWKKPRRIFVCAHSDLFHEAVPDEWIDQIFAVMALSPQHIFQVLTKRPERMRSYLLARKGMGNADICRAINAIPFNLGNRSGALSMPLPNVWLGVSIEDQVSANERIPFLLGTPGATRWISAEPLLGPVDIDLAMYGQSEGRLGMSCFGFTDGVGHEALLQWVVVGGESGSDARPMHPAWARSLRDQCRDANVPFLFKQWGGWVPRSACYHTFEDGKSCADYDPEAKLWPCVRLTELGKDGRQLENEDSGDSAYMQRVGKKVAGRLLDGVLHDGYPD